MSNADQAMVQEFRESLPLILKGEDPLNQPESRRHYERRVMYRRCSEPGCDGRRLARGLCNMHYRRVRRAEKRVLQLRAELEL